MNMKINLIKSICFTLIVVTTLMLVGIFFFPIPPTEDDFSLEISVSQSTFTQGQDIDVEIVFRNLTRGTYIVSRARPMIVVTVVGQCEGTDACFYGGIRMMISERDLIGMRERRVLTSSMGKNLEPGEHQLVAEAEFRRSSSNFRIVSNTIILTVRTIYERIICGGEGLDEE